MKKTISPLLCRSLLAVLTLSLSAVSCKSVNGSSRNNSEIKAESGSTQVAPQILRFTVLLDKLDRDMLGLSPQDASNKLVSGNARETAFLLQALGRVYETLDPKFKDVRIKFKQLEDGIGNYAKWVELLGKGQNSGAAPDVIEKLTKNRDDALVKMVAMLDASKFVPGNPATPTYHQTLRQFLNSYKWHDAATDRQEMLAYFRNELEMIKNTKWDFSHLEEGEGVHEYRRKIRWIPMEAKAMNGMITLKPNTTPCPISIYESVVRDGVANSKYGVLPPSATEKNPITLTPCLYVQIAKLVDVVGAIKGNIEEVDNNSSAGAATDSVSARDREAVEKIAYDTNSTNLWGLLQAELVEAPAPSTAAAVETTKIGTRISNAANPEYCLNTQVVDSVKLINVYTCSAHQDGIWEVKDLGNGFSSIRNPGANHCVNLKASTEGTEARGTICAVNPDQSWKVVVVDGGYTQFESQRAPGLCLSMPVAANAGKVTVVKCDASVKSQVWMVK